METLEGWRIAVLLAAPIVTFIVGIVLGMSWRRETTRALEKSVEDRDAMIHRQATKVGTSPKLKR